VTHYADSTILVTGGAGFIGSHLVEELVRRGSKVTVVDNLSTGRESNLAAVSGEVDLHGMDLVSDDLGPLLSDRSFDSIVHLAAHANIPDSVNDPRLDFEGNAVATFNLLETVRTASPGTRILHASSAAIYGEGVRLPIHEDDPTRPIAPYGASKLAAEAYASVYTRVFGLRAAVARLFSVYGPRLRKQVIWDLMCKIHDNPHELFILGDGTQVREFNHVANAVDALLTVLERGPLEGEAYNVAAEESVTIKDLATQICEAMGASPRFAYSGDVRPGEAQRWHADTSRLKALGYEPRVGISEGLSDTVSWFLGEQALV
jgi:UDP-glucose 4-epimerase